MRNDLGIAKLAGDHVMEKEASILGGLALAGLIHVTPNVAMKAVKSTDTGHKALAGTFSAGVKNGIEGKKLHPNFRSALEYGIGPESVLDYNIGTRIGKGLKRYGVTPERQERYLGKVKSMMGLKNLSPEELEKVRETPIIGSFHRFLNDEGSNRAEKIFRKFTVDEDAAMTTRQKAGNVAMLAGAGAADPHLLLQPAFSYGRKTLAKSELGKNMLKTNFEKALDGKEIPKWKERAIDTIVSPGVLDTHRIGKMTREVADEDVVKEVKKLTKEL